MKRNLAALLFLSTLMSACTTGAVTQSREAPTGVGTGEAIGFIFSHQFSLDTRLVEEGEIIGCISDAARKADPSLRIVLPDEFRHTVFPDLAPEAVPDKPEYFALLLDHSAFMERLAALGIRYLISVSGVTLQTGGPGAGAIGGPGAGVLVIAGSWDRTTSLTASVLDFQQKHVAGKLEASAAGHPWVLIVFPSPLMIGAPAFTESKACQELGEAVAKFIAGDETPGAQGTQR
jgi:hypothetical protein